MQSLSKFGRWLIPFFCILLLTGAGDVQGQTYDDRVPPAIRDTVYDHYEQHVITIKFRDDVRMRLRNGRMIDIDGRTPVDRIDAINELAARGRWLRHQSVGEAGLDRLRREGEARSGRPLPDLNNYVRLQLPPDMDALDAVARAERLPLVERADLVEKPLPSPAEIPNFTHAGAITGNLAEDRYQRYLDAAPDGIDARWAWLGTGGNGDGVSICDLEKNANLNHADLNEVTDAGQTPNPARSDNHGTAVLGVVGGKNNGVGVTGIAYAADLYFASTTPLVNGQEQYSVASAIAACADALSKGDIIIIEAQIRGPNFDSSIRACFGCVPVEWSKENYDAIVTAVANGIIVVEAGANGSQDLDDSVYQTGNSGHYPFKSDKDSGAIIVGAGNSPYTDWDQNGTPRAAVSFSNYGSTVDLQGWGDGVVTAGYGDLYPGDNPPNAAQKNSWYARTFAGTSSASPIVAGAAAVVQSTYKFANNGGEASPAFIKQVLRDTGTPQEGKDNIGPLPNLRAAITEVLGPVFFIEPPTINPPAGTYEMPMEVLIGYGDGTQNSSNTNIRYTLGGSEPNENSFIFIPEQGDSVYLNYGATIKAKAFQYDPDTQRSYESATTTVTYESSTPKVEAPQITPGGGFYNQPHQVVISTDTPGATIRYRTDGRAPSFFYPGTDYTGPITLEPGEYELVARAYKDGYYKSDATYTDPIVVNPTTLPAPTLYPNGGTFNGELTVYMGSTVLGAQIRYTLDGSTPSESSPLYVEPLELLPENGAQEYTLRARVFLAGYTPSPTETKEYFVVRTLNAPTIEPNGGEFTGTVTVTLTTDEPDATIRYTTNGAEPTSYSTAYAGPFTLDVGEHVVKARAYGAGVNPSETASAPFTVYTPIEGQAQPPIFDPDGGNHTESVRVSLRSETAGANIKYTFDISPLPEDQWIDYTAPFTLTDDTLNYVIGAKAYKQGMADSELSQTSFNVFEPQGTVEPPEITPPGGTYFDTVQVTVDGHTNPPFQIRQLHITTDGTDPAPESNTAGESSPKTFPINESTTVKALAAQLGYYNSDIVTNDYVLQCAKPQITSASSGPGAHDVTMSTSTPSSTIRYTTDGTPPTEASAEYAGPFQVGVGNTVIHATCYRTGFVPSETASTIAVVTEPAVSPAIEAQPQGRTVDASTGVSFTVDYTGVPTPTVQWQFNGRDIAGENEPVLEIPAAQTGNAGTYRAVVRNADGAETSEEVSLAVNDAAISGLAVESSSPTPLGRPTYFAASVSSGSNISYTWDFGDGATASGQAVNHTYAAQGSYTVTVMASNTFGTESASTTVVVTEPLPTPEVTPSVTPSVTVTPTISVTPSPSVTPTTPTPTGTPPVSGEGPQIYLPLMEKP